MSTLKIGNIRLQANVSSVQIRFYLLESPSTLRKQTGVEMNFIVNEENSISSTIYYLLLPFLYRTRECFLVFIRNNFLMF